MLCHLRYVPNKAHRHDPFLFTSQPSQPSPMQRQRQDNQAPPLVLAPTVTAPATNYYLLVLAGAGGSAAAAGEDDDVGAAAAAPAAAPPKWRGAGGRSCNPYSISGQKARYISSEKGRNLTRKGAPESSSEKQKTRARVHTRSFPQRGGRVQGGSK